MTRKLLLPISLIALTLFSAAPGVVKSGGEVDSSADPLERAFRQERNGWIYVHLEGTPEEIGYQHSSLLAREINEALRVFKKYLKQVTKRDWQFYRESARSLFWEKIGDEYRKEIEAIARGAASRGVKIDRDDVLAMNGWMELAWYYAPSHDRYPFLPPSQ